MNRRHLLQTMSMGGVVAMVGSRRMGLAQATPEVIPDDAEMAPDHRARELSALLATIPPLALMDALEATPVSEPLLRDDALAEGPVVVLSWNDPLDTDIEHALGAILVVGNDALPHDEALQMLGAVVVYESADIAYDQLQQKLGPDPNYASMTVAGTKAWLVSESGGEGALAIFRVSNVLVIASEAPGAFSRSEGLLLHLAAVAQSI